MGLMDWAKGQFIEIIEWLDSSRDTMVYRFPVHNNEIKNGAKLTVREGQAAVFELQGKIADVMAPGMYTIDGKNTPILSTIMGWKYGFASPFKSEVYFVNTREFTGMKWGTQNPIMMRDADFGIVRLRAFGSYAFQVTDPGLFLKDIVGTDGLYETDKLSDYLRDMLIQSFSQALGTAKIPALDLAANYRNIGTSLTKDITADFASHGLTLTHFIISNISLPPEVEAAMDKRTEMGALGDLNKFTQFQVANAITDAAKQPGGMAGMGMGMGAGMGMGGMMMNQMNQAMYPQQQQQQPPPPPPAPVAAAPAAAAAPAPGSPDDVMARLGQLKKLMDAGLIEKAEFDEKKKDLLSKL